MLRTLVLCIFVSLTAEFCCAGPTQPPTPAGAQASRNFDARVATDAWLASVPQDAKARSDAYFEGGYWLTLWDFLWTVAIMLILLFTGLSARMRDWSERVSKSEWLKPFLYWIQFAVICAVLYLPLTIYEDFIREHAYGLSNQTFAAWFRDAVIGFALLLFLGGIAVTAIFAVVRVSPRHWHWWGAAVGVLFSIFVVAIAPVFIAPLFNKYTSLPDSPLKQQILSLARQNGIPAADVYENDASRQSKRVSANVSGFLGTQRITLNDNLLNRCSPQAVLAVMGHEMGHYVLHHVVNGILFAVIVIVGMFALLRYALNRALARWGARWGIRGVSDPAALPAAVAILAILSFLFTPFSNTFTRTQEYEADIFGLNTSRQPDGEAESDILLGEYRKLDPTPVEEFIFYDHPSGRTRIYAAMRWKEENLCLFDPKLPCKNAPKS